eukprot:TRINITY_DN35101_c0_g1_i1.p1 TRINITY_DN35101_c0_g1~~TRINITY_DN35101_c0_g1_i1.p1  ORF type:complete len:592 (-),score=92.68 TRINITY_DN35101_c0_g1_i1:13-1755(-)
MTEAPGRPGQPIESSDAVFSISLEDEHSPTAAADVTHGRLDGKSELQESEQVPAEVEEYVTWALEHVDDWGLFQRRSTGIVGAIYGLCAAQMMVHIFVAQTPRLKGVCTAKVDHCEVDCSLPAEAYEFDVVDFSVASEFHLVCDAAYKVPLLGSILFFGVLLGVLYFGRLADRTGRRRAYLWSICLTQGSALLAAVAPNYTVYSIARCLIGFGTGGLSVATYVWNAEIIPARIRPWLIATQNCSFAFALVLLAPLAYMLPHWRWILFVLFLLGVPFIVFQRFVLESPKWLASAGRLDDAHKVLCQIAALNGRPDPPTPPLPRASQADGAEDSPGQSLLGALLCDTRLAWRFIAMCLAWFSVSLGYYGVSMNASNLGSSIYFSSAALSAVELPMFPAAIWLVKVERAGRRGATAGGLIIGGACCVFGSFAPDSAVLLMCFAFTGKAAIALAFGVTYLYATELFPTNVRSGSLGLQSFCARIGGMLAPLVADLGKSSKALPFVVFGLPCTLAGILLCSLPETAGKPLPNTVEDIPSASGPAFPCLRRYRELEEDTQHCEGVGMTPMTAELPFTPTKLGASVA